MNANDLTPEKQLFLRQAIDTALRSTYYSALRFGKNTNKLPQEPDFVAALTINFAPQLASILKSTFPSKKFSLTGVFCHQKPRADFGDLRKAEIGDILFVYVSTDKNGGKLFNSLLLQAKIAANPIKRVSKKEDHQLKLYSEWPRFLYEYAGPLNGIMRNILPKTINNGAQYLLINKGARKVLDGGFIMGCAVPSSKLIVRNSLATELVDFLLFKSGRSFQDRYPEPEDNWSRMIWDILDITKNNTFKRIHTGVEKAPRQIVADGENYCFYLSETESIYGDLHDALERDDNQDNVDFLINFHSKSNKGIPIFLIECND